MDNIWFEYAKPEHFWMDWRARVVLTEIREQIRSRKTFLEIGCGAGVFRSQMESALDITIDGCDLNREALECAVPGRGRLMLYNIFDRAPELITKYDIIFLMDVIEHIDDDLAFLKAAAHHLSPDGICIINVPSGPFLRSAYDTIVGHKRRYTKRSLRALLAGAGLDVVKIRYWGFTMMPFLLARKLLIRSRKPRTTVSWGFMPHPVVGWLFNVLKEIETRVGIAPPGGTSLLAIAKKNNNLKS